MIQHVLSLGLVTCCCMCLSGCFSLFRGLPEREPLPDRIASFPIASAPVSKPVQVWWSDHEVPFIDAQSDEDCAVVLGMVHAHLRLGQLELLRRISQGRLAEGFGPLVASLDESLRIMRFDYATNDIIATMDPAAKRWMQSFVKGLNHVQNSLTDLPQEFVVLGVQPEPWTLEDLITMGRVIASDVNWFVSLSMLELKDRDGFEDFIKRIGRASRANLPTGGKREPTDLLRLLVDTGKNGSNAVAVGSKRSTTGSSLLAADPHLSVGLPSLWLAVGLRSPSYYATGLMFPGFPFPALGRSQYGAWGGTSARARSTDIYELSEEDIAAATTSEHAIAVRWWPDRTSTSRWTRFGPVISDAPLLEDYDGPPLAIRWLGHQASDEIRTFLQLMRAENVQDFRAAFRGFFVPGQNMLWADRNGDIALILGATIPVREPDRPFQIIPTEHGDNWKGLLDSNDLPAVISPESGWIGSANNQPFVTQPQAGEYGNDDRYHRLIELFEHDKPISMQDLINQQLDVTSPISRRLAHTLASMIDDSNLSETQQLLAAWQGDYTVESSGALAFQALVARLTNSFYKDRYHEDIRDILRFSHRALFFLAQDLDVEDPEQRKLVTSAASAAQYAVNKYENWGNVHQLTLEHPFSAIPMVGNQYKMDERGVAGSALTLRKNAHSISPGKHEVSFGQNARFLADTGDIDETWFCLLGGNDGAIGSTNIIDQIDHWYAGEYIQLPLDPKTVAGQYPFTVTVTPK